MARLLILAGLIALVPAAARAEMIDFSYSWAVGPSAFYTGTNPDTSDGVSTGSITFALSPAGSSAVAIGGASPTRVSGATITTTSSAGGSFAVDSFATSFSLNFSLTDTASGQSGTTTFQGGLSGTLTANTSDLTARFDGPLTRQMTLGENIYAITIDPSQMTVPAPGSPNPGSIDALVRVVGAVTQAGPLPEAPEPASLLTGAVGSALGLLAWARGRRVRRPE